MPPALLILLVVVLLFGVGGGGALYGRSQGWGYGASFSPVGIILLLIVVWLLLGH